MAAAPAGGSVPQFASLYVGDLHPDVTEAMLYEVFNSVGPVGSIRVCRDSVTRRSLGYGYVNFHAVADAERALDTLNYSSIKGRACRIMWSQRDPSLRKSGAGNIYVKNLDKNIDNKALYDTFSLFGNILSCKVASDREGKSFGYGFVHYETEEAAKQAIERVNGMQIGEQTVEVMVFKKVNDRENPAASNFTNLYIKNFPQEWDEDKVKETFGSFGTITSSVLLTDNKGRKFAFVNFEDHDGAQKCVDEMNGKDFRSDEEKKKAEEDGDADDGKLYVGRAQSKAERAREFKQQNAGNASAKAPAQGVNLYVKNLDDTTDDESLKALFEPFGTVTSCVAMKDDKDKCKGFGFVSFSSPDDATKAVTEMHLKVVKGKPLYVGLAEKKEVRADRLRQRYTAGSTGKGKGGGKGGKGGGNPMMGMGGPMMGNPMMGNPMMGNPMMGKGMGNPMMGQMPGKGAMMGNPMMGQMPGKGGPMMMGGAPMMGMMGNPQMMGKGMPGMAPMGMMRPPMPQQAQMQARPPMQQQPQQPQPGPAGAPLNASALANAPPPVQKQMIGEKLYPQIARINPELAGKITGMMLEMDNSELLMLLESEQQLRTKVQEAVVVLSSK